MSKRSWLVWCADTVLISLEIIFAYFAYQLFHELAWVGFGWQSVGELISNLVTVFYIRGVLKSLAQHKKMGTVADDHEFHVRQAKAAKYIVWVFYALAFLTFAWIPIAGYESPVHADILWPRVTIVVFAVCTFLMTVIKYKMSEDKHGPQWADFLQSAVCVVAGLIAGLADWLQQSFAYSHLCGDIVIGILLIYAGRMVHKNKRPCC